MPDVNTLEDIYESIGGFGRFQFFAICAILLPEVPAGVLAMLPVFVGAHPRFWTCTEKNDFEYNIDSTSANDDGICGCNGTLFGGRSSIVSEWNLVCEYAWVTDFITSIQMVGMMLGSSFGSQIPDWFGRKKSLYLFCLIMLTMGVASGFTESPFVYAATRFFIGLSIGPYINLDVFYVIEILPLNWRSLAGALGPWSIGVMLLAPLAYFMESWKLLSWVSALPMAFAFVSYPFLPESPRWLLQSGKVEEAKEALDTMARWNGYPPVDFKTVENLAFGSLDVSIDDKDEQQQLGRQGSKVGCRQLLKNPQQRYNIVIFTFAWFSLAGIYYGIGFNTKNLGGNPYLNLLYMGLVEAVGFPTAFFANKWFGRRMALLGYFALSTVALAGIILMELNLGIEYNSSWVTYLALTARFSVSGGWGAVKCFTAESFSTDTRSTALGVCSTASSIAGIIAPQLVFLGTMYRPVPYFVFGALSLIGIATSLLLNETKGKSLTTE